MEKFISKAMSITFAIVFFASTTPKSKISWIATKSKIRIKKIFERSRTTAQALETKVDLANKVLLKAIDIKALKKIAAISRIAADGIYTT